MTSINIEGGRTGLVAQSVTAGLASAYDRQACDEWIRNSGLVDVDGILESIKASKRRVPGTCQWIKQRDEYHNWLYGNEQNRLWISADPGAGKTTILTTIIDDLQQSSDKDCPLIVLFFFFDDRADNQSSATTAILSLIAQLLKQQPQLFDHVRHVSRTDLKQLSSLWGCLRKMTEGLTQTAYILLDALDECLPSQVSDLLNHLSDEASPLKAKILVNCRSEVTKPQSYLGLHIHLDDIKDDIVKVIDARIEELANYPLELREQIKRRLYYATGRTFLWVSLLIEYLKTETPDQFLSRVGSNYVTEESLHKVMPAKLSEVYDRILNKITSAHGNRRVRFILYCVIAARRPLTERELAMSYCLGWKMKQCDRIPDTMYLDCRKYIWTLCKPILFLDDKTDAVNLTHQTAKEYLMKSCLIRDWSISDFRQLDLLSAPWIYDFRKILRMHLDKVSLQLFPLSIVIAFFRTILMYLGVFMAYSETNLDEANRLMFRICWRYLEMRKLQGDQETVNVELGKDSTDVSYNNQCYEYASKEWYQHFLALSQTSTNLLIRSRADIQSLRQELVRAVAASDGIAGVLPGILLPSVIPFEIRIGQIKDIDT
ncbi:hypothetical protein EDB82DRAFT_473158 [Fusarium venenatum]|uniref:uncharacterized protein n=1 Tax=Fusarium venenatum TaxID=56646 RepID=UPI001D636C58|nr:hypothetical protein EDB82DRAFT_473158 [Fusarium venenatum]